MKKRTLILTLALSASVALMAAAQQRGNRPGRPGGPGERDGIHLLPPPALEQLNLTADQQKQLAALETELRAKLAKILSADQLQQLEQMRPPRPEGGPGGPGGPGGFGGPGGPGGMSGPGDRGRLSEHAGGMGMRPARPTMPIIEALDANHDETIDADELAKASASLKKLDQNKDGKLTPDEYRPQLRGGRGPGQPGGPGNSGAQPGRARPAFEN